MFPMQVWSPNCIFSIDLSPSRHPKHATPRWKDWAALQLFSSGVGPLRSSICSINCLNAQLVSGSRPASSPRCSGDASRETAGPPAPLAEPLMVIVADRPDAVKVRKWCAETGENSQKSVEEGKSKTISVDIKSIFLLLYFIWSLTYWSESCFFLTLHFILVRMSKCHPTEAKPTQRKMTAIRTYCQFNILFQNHSPWHH